MKTCIAFAVALAAAPFAAQSVERSYTFVEAGYTELRMDAPEYGDPEFDGGYLRGSFDVGRGVNVIGGVSRLSQDFTLAPDLELGIDLRHSEIGVGYHMAFTERVDFVGEVAFVRVDWDAQAGTYRDDGHVDGGRAALGVRGAVNDVVEASLKANYYDGGDFAGRFTGVLGAQVRIGPTWGITAEMERGELVLSGEDTRYWVGVRASL